MEIRCRRISSPPVIEIICSWSVVKCWIVFTIIDSTAAVGFKELWTIVIRIFVTKHPIFEMKKIRRYFSIEHLFKTLIPVFICDLWKITKIFIYIFLGFFFAPVLLIFVFIYHSLICMSFYEFIVSWWRTKFYQNLSFTLITIEFVKIFFPQVENRIGSSKIF